MIIRVGILTISDRSSRGERPDSSGEILKKMITTQGWNLSIQGIVPDEFSQIAGTLSNWCDQDKADVILTTGGTGFSPRDVTPEATQSIIQRQAPGLSEAIRAAGMRITPHAMLSRAMAGIRSKTLIINFPGSPKAVEEDFQVVLPVLPHAVELLRSNPDSESHHRVLTA